MQSNNSTIIHVTLRDIQPHHKEIFAGVDYFSAMAGSMHARMRASFHALRHSEIQWDTMVCLSMQRLLFPLQPAGAPSNLLGMPLREARLPSSSFFLLSGDRCRTVTTGTVSGRQSSGQLLFRWASGAEEQHGKVSLRGRRGGMLPLLVESARAPLWL